MSRYFLVTFLPQLVFDAVPEISSHRLKFYLQQNLSSKEMAIVNDLRTFQDLENLRSFLLRLPMTATGSIPRDELAENLHDPDFVMPGAEDFYKKYPTVLSRQEHAHELLHSFLTTHKKMAPFVQKYFRFENIYRNILAWLRAKDLHKPADIAAISASPHHQHAPQPSNNEKNFQGSSPDCAEIGFEIDDVKNWPELYQDLPRIWDRHRSSPSDLEMALSQWKFQAIDCLCEQDDLFSFDLILAYLVKLRIVEEREMMNDPRHQLMLQEMVKAHD